MKWESLHTVLTLTIEYGLGSKNQMNILDVNN